MRIRVKEDLAALGDDSQAVVFEIPEGIRTALEELHLAVESFDDAVVARETPHTGIGWNMQADWLDPVIEFLGECLQGSRPALPQEPDGRQQPVDGFLALSLALEFVVREFAELVHFEVVPVVFQIGHPET